MIVIKGGTVLSAEGWREADVAIEHDRVVAVDDNLRGEETVDVSGCLVGPGFVDLHTHLREPGQTWKEDITSGSAAAAAGGFTAVVVMPNTHPAIDSVETSEAVRQRGRHVGRVDVIPAAALTVGRAGREPSDLEALYRSGIRVFTDDGDCLQDRELLEEIMTRLSVMDDGVVAQHAESPGPHGDTDIHDGEVARHHHITGLPPEVETDMVRRDLDLARSTGARYHIQHVSSMATLELIREAKADGLAVSAEVTPHHLVFDETSLEDLDTDFKMYPPLRSPQDRKMLVEGLVDGTIDVVATDHAPHTAEEKSVGFMAAPRGVIGLETAAAALWETVADPDLLFSRLSTTPARIARLTGHGRPVAPGAPANLVAFDPTASWVADTFESKSANSPFRGRRMTGRAVLTMFHGRSVHGMVPV